MTALNTALKRWYWKESHGGKWFIYAEGDDQPLIVPNRTASTRSKTAQDLDAVLQHIVTAHNCYLDSIEAISNTVDAIRGGR